MMGADCDLTVLMAINKIDDFLYQITTILISYEFHNRDFIYRSKMNEKQGYKFIFLGNLIDEFL